MKVDSESKCEICGKSAESTPKIARLCIECREEYRVFHCSSCDMRVVQSSTFSDEDLCSTCSLLPLLEGIPKSKLDELREEWKSGNRFQALQEIRKILDVGINDAVTILHQP